MKVTIIPSNTVSIEIDGKPISGSFQIVSEWEGFLKLESSSPRNSLIVKKPPSPNNPFDFIQAIFGGGQAPDKTKSIEADLIASTLPIS